MVMESAINEHSDFRDIVDLIWFPTGGGKTEAYLGVMAFLFAYRRITAPASANGTMAIMRYTLRLLTAQQFTRACKVISALELIRREDTRLLGNTPISIGLWVGAASSPNSLQTGNYRPSGAKIQSVLLSMPAPGVGISSLTKTTSFVTMILNSPV